jgi:hypothetical protein
MGDENNRSQVGAESPEYDSPAERSDALGVRRYDFVQALKERHKSPAWFSFFWEKPGRQD